jgi:hypothetical protein
MRQRATDLLGPLTLHEALAVVLPVANGLDTTARLTFITSGLDLQHDGRSFTWEFGCALPKLTATAMIGLEPSVEAENPDESPLILRQRVNPASTMDLQRPLLPVKMRNSPEVVAALAAKGVDLVAGPSDMKLESRVLDSGEAIWVTYYYDRELTTRLASTDSQKRYQNPI